MPKAAEETWARCLLAACHLDGGRTTNDPPTTRDECANNGLKEPMVPFGRNRALSEPRGFAIDFQRRHDRATTMAKEDQLSKACSTLLGEPSSSLPRKCCQGDARPPSTTSSGGHCLKEALPDCAGLPRHSSLALRGERRLPLLRARLSSRIAIPPQRPGGCCLAPGRCAMHQELLVQLVRRTFFGLHDGKCHSR